MLLQCILTLTCGTDVGSNFVVQQAQLMHGECTYFVLDPPPPMDGRRDGGIDGQIYFAHLIRKPVKMREKKVRYAQKKVEPMRKLLCCVQYGVINGQK